ncbi:MAG: flagellar biosynthetic protein FliR [Polyangiaceae bacterium]
MSLLGELVRAEVLAFVLEASRIAGLVIVAPLPWAFAPIRVRTGLTLVLAVAGHGLGGATHALADAPSVVLALASEVALGLALGFVVRLSVAVAEVAAEVVAPMIGLGAAHLFDPHGAPGDTVLSGFLRYSMILVASLVGIHRVVLGAVLETFRLIPVGSVARLPASVPTFVRLTSDAFAAGVRLAIPIVVVVFMIQVALAYISRAAPAMQIFSVGFAVTLMVGLALLFLTAPDTVGRMVAEWSFTAQRIELVLAPLVGSAP